MSYCARRTGVRSQLRKSWLVGNAGIRRGKALGGVLVGAVGTNQHNVGMRDAAMRPDHCSAKFAGK